MPLYKSEDGQVHQVIDSEVITRELLIERLDISKAAVAVDEKELAEFDRLTNPVEAPAPVETPAEQAQEIAEDAANLAETLADPGVSPAPVAPAEQPPVAAPADEQPVAPVILQ